MLNFISIGKKIVLPTNSKMEADVYKKIIEETFPDKKIQLYSSEMLASEKNEHFSNLNKYWGQLDVLIYTPTCSAGISFEEEHFDFIFAHFTDASCDVETCRQMLMRVRNIRTKTYYIYIPPYSSNSGNYPITTEEISAALKNKKLAMFKDCNLQFEYSKDGDIIYYESNYFYLWLENTRIENLSKNNFVGRFIDQVVECGATIEFIKSENIDNELKEKYKNVKMGVKTATAGLISGAEDISLDTLIAIQDKKKSNDDVLMSEIYSCEKYYIKDIYKINFPIDINFILTYNNENIKRVFKYLSKICSYPSIEEGLDDMRTIDIEAYSSIEAFKGSHKSYQEGAEYYNLVKYKYVFTNHLSLQELIKICGFSFTDIFKYNNENKLDISLMEKKLRDNIFNIEKYLILLIPEMNISKSQSNISLVVKKNMNESDIKIFVKKMIKLINFGLRSFYGIEVEKNKDEYFLTMGKIALLFTYNEINIIDKPNIICKLIM